MVYDEMLSIENVAYLKKYIMKSDKFQTKWGKLVDENQDTRIKPLVCQSPQWDEDVYTEY